MAFTQLLLRLTEKLSLAAWMIFAGAFLDAMDGKIARFTKSSSKFGVEYDSSLISLPLAWRHRC